MRGRVIKIGLSQADELETEVENETVRPAVGTIPLPLAWTPERFAKVQVQGLVRQVFFPHHGPPAKQVVFIPIDQETAARRVCRRAGETLAEETAGAVAVLGSYSRRLRHSEPLSAPRAPDDLTPLKREAIRVRNNLWLVSSSPSEAETASDLQSYLLEIRQQFEYSIVEAPHLCDSIVAQTFAQLADGIVLVLCAQRTRRMAAFRAVESFEKTGTPILGVVLTDRTFPIPEPIYRRL